MKPLAILIVGMPGSGKTYLGSKLSGTFFDDFSLMNKDEALKNVSGDIIIADVFLCEEENRILAQKYF